MQFGGAPESRPMMTIQESVKTCLRKYADFSGRATRAEIWWWVLATLLVGIGISVVDSALGFTGVSYGFTPLSTIFGLAILLPDLAVTCRRLHDIGKSGWWQLAWYIIGFLGAIPLILGVVFGVVTNFSSTDGWEFGGDWEVNADGLIVVLVGIFLSLMVWLGLAVWWILWIARQGETGPNRYGPDPRAVSGDTLEVGETP